MEYLDMGGKRYMKVSSAARETGYTSDYIGQLCRAKKIDAKLVGRTWYVLRDEITAHKRTRGRSTYEKTRQAVKTAIASAGETSIPIHRNNTLPSRERLTSSLVKYHPDDTALIPAVAAVAPESRHMHVRTSTPRETAVSFNEAEIEHIAVGEEGGSVQFNTSTPREVVWNGTIVVSALEDQEIAPPTPAPVPSKNVSPLERHLRVYRAQERNNKVNLGISSISHDPLEEKARFLERMNLAHDFNTHARTSVAQSPERVYRRSAPARVSATQGSSVAPRPRTHAPTPSPAAHVVTWKGVLWYILTLSSVAVALLTAAATVSSEHTYLSSGIAHTGITRYTSRIHLDSLRESLILVRSIPSRISKMTIF